jgi:type IV pilus assembly protein PilC
MAQIFNYAASDRNGKKITGKKEFASREDLANYLHEQGLVILSIEEVVGLDWEQLASIQIGGVPLSERVVFVKQLSTMLSAGLPLIQALSILVEQTENIYLKKKLQRVYQDVASGISLSEAFRKDETIFNEVQLNLLVAGEKSGNLNEIMEKIATDLEKTKDLRGKLVGAMIYPVILLIVLVLVVMAMLVFMVPAVEALYADFGVADLPFATKVLVDASKFVTSPVGAIAMIIFVIAGYLGFRYYFASYDGRRVIDKLTLQMPIFGALLSKAQLAEFNRLTSLLLVSGVSIVETLNIVANALSNTAFSDLVRNAVIQVSKGNSITLPLSKNDVFPLMMLKMLATGEETGKLDQVTNDMAKYYDKEVEEITGNLAKLMEPLIMVLVGGVVAFLAVAIYLPIYQLGQFSS